MNRQKYIMLNPVQATVFLVNLTALYIFIMIKNFLSRFLQHYSSLKVRGYNCKD